jgi:hypothetical protein
MSILSDCIGQDDGEVILTASDFQNSGSGSDVPEGDKSQSVFLLCVEMRNLFEIEIDMFISALLPSLNELL